MKNSLRFLFILISVGTCHYANSQSSSKPIFIIVQGAYGGSWGYRQVDSLLTEKGCVVYRPSLTGLGERVHLSSPDIGLDTHILDVVNMILYEDLHNIILVGHSYGGMVITGVADSIPERMKKLIYIDASLPVNGESNMMIFGKEGEEALIKRSVNGYMIPTWVPEDKAPPKDVPQPLKTYTDKILLNNSLAQKIPGIFISCGWKEMAERAKKKGWPVFELGTDHNVQWSNPEGLADLLITIAND